ncbi:MAG: nuclear transport factor 2 family protein [Lysobacteraceae bacterium]
MKVREIFPTLLGLLVLAGPATALDERRVADTVRGYIEASNQRDVQGVLRHTTDDFRWMHILGDRVEVEVAGQGDLESWLQAWYASTPGARTEIGEVLVDGSYATTVETVRWNAADGGERAQSATSVYHLDDAGLIRAVWYFPAQRKD